MNRKPVGDDAVDVLLCAGGRQCLGGRNAQCLALRTCVERQKGAM